VIRWSLFVAMALGVGGFVALLLYNGFGEILGGVAAVGWGLALIVAIRLGALSIAGLAWGAALGRAVRRPVALLIGLRIIREAINCLLPAAQIGGDLIGGRLLARTGVAPGLAMAGILVDVLLQTVTQGSFALVGLAVLWFGFGDIPVVRELGWGAIAAVPALGGFFLAQRFGLFALVDRSLTAEIWIALSRMGARPNIGEAVVLESLGQAVRSAGFAVPGALGIQEGGFILLGSLFGLSAASAVALSLVKRLPDLAIGLPGLFAWQGLEMALLRRPRAGLDHPA